MRLRVLPLTRDNPEHFTVSFLVLEIHLIKLRVPKHCTFRGRNMFPAGVEPPHVRVFHKDQEADVTNVSVLIYRRSRSRDGMFNSKLQIYDAAKYHWTDVNI